MDMWDKLVTLELFRNSDNNETIDDLQTMTMLGMFDDEDDDLF